jgi:hypothetical protein
MTNPPSSPPDLFSVLPGIDVPVAGIAKGLARMWRDNAAQGAAAPGTDDARATQVNFVLHLGPATTPEDALAQFQIAVRFSQRCPSRVVILCPQLNRDAPAELRAKIYGECFLGKSKADKRCVEFVILSYPRATREFLENQVSICLSTDLPLYYWAHRFTNMARVADYRYLVTRASRILIDSAHSPADALSYAWPRPEIVRDLAFSRLLPLRQTLGQFLSRYPAAALAEGLQTVALAHAPALLPEARVLLAWLKGRLAACGENRATFVLAPLGAGQAGSFSLAFSYADKKSFRWTADLATGHAQFTADFGNGPTTLPAPASLLSPESALSEAMFF